MTRMRCQGVHGQAEQVTGLAAGLAAIVKSEAHEIAVPMPPLRTWVKK